MKLKTYNIFMLIATVIAWLSFWLVITSFDPTQSSLVVFIFFYFSFFLSILGTLTLLGYALRKLLNRKKVSSYRLVKESFRQAIIFAGVLAIALLMQSGRLLVWWNIVLIILTATILEFIFLVFSKENKMI